MLRGTPVLVLTSAAALLLAPSCRANAIPVVFVVPPEARKIQRAERGGAAGVNFAITEPYPAKRFLGQVNLRMKTLGWTPLEMDWMNPTIPSSHKRGWQSFIDARKPERKAVHQWMGQWRNKTGEIVSYSLSYNSEAPADEFARIPDPSNSELDVNAELIPATIAAKIQKWAAAHPPETHSYEVAPDKSATPRHPSGDASAALRVSISDVKRSKRKMGDQPDFDGVSYKVRWENVSDAEITEFSGDLVLEDRNGNALSTMTMDKNGSVPARGSSIEDSWAPLDCDALGVKTDEIRIEWRRSTLRFADGTKVDGKPAILR